MNININEKEPVNTHPYKTGFTCNIMSRELFNKWHQKQLAFRCRKSERIYSRFPFVFASYTTALIAPYNITSRVKTMRTFISSGHATIISFLVAVLYLYPFFIIKFYFSLQLSVSYSEFLYRIFSY